MRIILYIRSRCLVSYSNTLFALMISGKSGYHCIGNLKKLRLFIPFSFRQPNIFQDKLKVHFFCSQNLFITQNNVLMKHFNV